MNAVQGVESFVRGERLEGPGRLTAVSLFSGAGLSDSGYERAGFRFMVQVEIDTNRAKVGQSNFPTSTWITGDVTMLCDQIVQAYRDKTAQRLDMLVATPPCQGMSSSNPSRGKRQAPSSEVDSKEQESVVDRKNRLILDLVPIAHALKPRVIVAENVRQILTLTVNREGHREHVIDLLRAALVDYVVFTGVVDVADYGIPQTRKRAIIVAVHKDEVWLPQLAGNKQLPWPVPTHAETPDASHKRWVTVRDWLMMMKYESIDAKSKETARGQHRLHFVPTYDDDRYLQISQIEPYSGRSAYQNNTCPRCGLEAVPEWLALCGACGGLMRNRPYLVDSSGHARLIKGFVSSYRRMPADLPARTITTNSSHVGSDYKIHPWENRVLSILECADIQTVPRWYDWSVAFKSKLNYLIRNVIGEAFPPYFTYLHGEVLGRLLANEEIGAEVLASVPRRRPRRKPEQRSLPLPS